MGGFFVGGAAAYELLMGTGAITGGYMAGHALNNVRNSMQNQSTPPPASPNSSDGTSYEGDQHQAAGQGANSTSPQTPPGPQCKGCNDEEKKKQHQRELGTDPKTGQFRQSEADAGTRLESELNTTLERDPTGQGDWIDPATGQVYDAVGPAPANQVNIDQFNQSISNHLLKSGISPVVDTTGFSEAQSNAVSNYISNLDSASQARIIRLGE